MPICYLCGVEMPRGDRTKDHCPPRMMFADRLLQDNQGLNLTTIKSHGACNAAYREDEEYFTAALIAHASDTSMAGRALWEQFEIQRDRPQIQAIMRLVISQFDFRPGGLHLPPGMVYQRTSVERIWRVWWKIVRGLHFKTSQQFIPAEHHFHAEELKANEAPRSKMYNLCNTQASRSRVPQVFDYKIHTQVTDGMEYQAWTLLFWNAVYLVGGFALRRPPQGEGVGE